MQETNMTYEYAVREAKVRFVTEDFRVEIIKYAVLLRWL